MNTVEVQFLLPIRTITNTKSVEFPIEANETIRTLLEKLIRRFGEAFNKAVFDDLGQPRRHIIIRHNGENINAKDDFGTRVRNGDVVAIMAAVAGG